MAKPTKKSKAESVEGWTEFPDGRVSIPLVMLEGNLDVLLNNTIPCTGISLVRHASGRGVVITINRTAEQREICEELGFRTGPNTLVALNEDGPATIELDDE